MRTAELELPPLEANAMSIPPHEAQPKRPVWDICWRSKRALVLMGIGCGLQWVLVLLLWRLLGP
jgi:hypothetical protein